MKEKDIELLKKEGWYIECENPFEIRHKESKSFFQGIYAKEYANDLLDVLKLANQQHVAVICDNTNQFMEWANKIIQSCILNDRTYNHDIRKVLQTENGHYTCIINACDMKAWYFDSFIVLSNDRMTKKIKNIIHALQNIDVGEIN